METSCFIPSNLIPKSTGILLPAHTWKAASTSNNQSRRFSLTCCQSVPSFPSPPQGAQKNLFLNSDWRAFRAKLVAVERADAVLSLPSMAYPDLPVTVQDKWAHTIPDLEKGCLLIATEKLDAVDVYRRTVILILSTGPVGPTGLILNRPSQISVKDMQSSPLDASPAFSDRPLFSGGPMEDAMFLVSPDEMGSEKIKRSGVFEEVMDGLYYGTGEHAGYAADMVRRGEIRARDLRFFNGFCAWEGTQLTEEIRAGLWTVAACSRSVVGLRSEGDIGLREEILGLLSPQKITDDLSA